MFLKKIAGCMFLFAFLVGFGNIACSNAEQKQHLLYQAIQNGDARTVSQLLRQGANVEQKTEAAEYSPLVFAAMYNKARCVEVLLEAGAKLNARDDSFGSSAIEAAVTLGSYDSARVLLEAGETDADLDELATVAAT